MNSAFFNIARRFGVKWFFLLSTIIGLVGGGNAAWATDAVANFSGSVTTPPQVDATTFINSATWNISVSPKPFMTANTLNYTNNGTNMTSQIGWEFDLGPNNSGTPLTRGWSANFFNNTLGNISAVGRLSGSLSQPVPVGYLLVSATNIVNKGVLSADPYSELYLTGSSVDLHSSRVMITPFAGSGSANDFIANHNFTPDTGIFDEYWGQTNIVNMTSSAIWDGTVAVSPSFRVSGTCGAANFFTQLAVFPAASDSITIDAGHRFVTVTNIDGSTTSILLMTNVIRQAVFIGISDPTITGQVRFSPSSNPTNHFQTVAVQLSTPYTNFVTLGVQTTSLYLVDMLASSTNRGLLPNSFANPYAACSDTTFRPGNYVLSRLDSGSFSGGQSGDGFPASDFLYQTDFTNDIIASTTYAGYSALVDNEPLQFSPAYALTNQPGRVHITANNLNLNKARIRGESEVVIQASNLVSSVGAVMDCQNLSYNLGSTTGFLNVTNLAQPDVSRFNGTISCWSGFWSNSASIILPNYSVSNSITTVTNPPGSTNITTITNVIVLGYSPLTNSQAIGLYALLVDASGLSSTAPVSVQDLILHSTNMVVSDPMTVVGKLLFDGQSLTIVGSLTLSGVLQNWSYAIAPKLRYFTNNGSLSIPNGAHFGDDGPTNYAVFVNNGTINAGSETINSDIFQGGGSQTTAEGFSVTTLSGKVENGIIDSGLDVQFNAGTLKFNQSTISAAGQLYFNVTGSLFDNGGASSNVLICGNGFDLPAKPTTTGDLLGTAIESFTSIFSSVDHYWSGTDLGVSSAGYSNNEAVGQLQLNEGFDSQFVFHATGATNAIYVDLLDLSQCPDFLDPNTLTIDPNFVIYYAAIKLPSSFTVPSNTNGIAQEAEEYMNGQLGGHLRWVSSFAGPNSSVDVLINGQTAQMNKALRFSKIIDSNGNGIPNYFDSNPFNIPGAMLSGSVVANNPPPTRKFGISWTAFANTVYQVQYSTNTSPASWKPLISYTNSASTNVVVTVWDTNVLSGQRFYRVSHP